MGKFFDLDKARSAREEEQNEEAPSFPFKGTEFTIPLRAPYAFGEALAMLFAEPMKGRHHLVRAVKILLGDQYEAFVALGPDEADVDDLVMAARRHYNELISGESPASDGSSSNGSGRSKPTSNASTGSTSKRRSTETDPSEPDASQV